MRRLPVGSLRGWAAVKKVGGRWPRAKKPGGQSVSCFTVPPRAHPSTGSQSGTAAPVLTQVPSTRNSLPRPGGYSIAKKPIGKNSGSNKKTVFRALSRASLEAPLRTALRQGGSSRRPMVARPVRYGRRNNRKTYLEPRPSDPVRTRTYPQCVRAVVGRRSRHASPTHHATHALAHILYPHAGRVGRALVGTQRILIC